MSGFANGRMGQRLSGARPWGSSQSVEPYWWSRRSHPGRDDIVRVAQDDRIVARIFDDEPKPLIPLFKFAQQTLEFVLAFAGADGGTDGTGDGRATSELQSLMRISYAVFCLNKKTIQATYPLL